MDQLTMVARCLQLLKLFMSAVDSNLVNASEIVEERDGSSVGDTEE